MPTVPLVIEPDPDEPEFASVLVDATIAGRAYRLVLDTGAAVTQLDTDEYLAGLDVVGHDTSSAAFGGRATDPLVTIPGLAAGELRTGAMDVSRSDRPTGSRLGMDILGRHRCHFRVDAGILDVDPLPASPLGYDLLVSARGHPYVELRWPGASASGCWDTGAGPTLVDVAFWHGHPELFTPAGTVIGTDGNGEQAETPLLVMAGPVIGGRAFAPHKAVAVDLSAVNSTLDYPMDVIVGYPTIRQADWLFDFPARRWALTS